MIKKFNEYYKVNEDDSYDENEPGTFTRTKTNKFNGQRELNNIIDRCLHDNEKDELKIYINQYIDNSPIVKSKNGWGFYGATTDDF